MYVLNIPPYATEASLKSVFSVAGDVQSVLMQGEEDHGFKIGYIVFAKTSSLLKALQLKELPPLTASSPIEIGLKKYMIDYNDSIMDHVQMQNEIDTFMTKYDKQEEIEQRKLKQQKEDEEGWTVVTRKGRNPGLSRKESVENKIAEKLQRKAKKKNLRNFYTFQIRESKKNHIVKLRQKFEDDKKRIEAFKKSRKFKPF